MEDQHTLIFFLDNYGNNGVNGVEILHLIDSMYKVTERLSHVVYCIT